MELRIYCLTWAASLCFVEGSVEGARARAQGLGIEESSTGKARLQGPLTPLRYGRGCSSGGGTRFGPLSCTFGVTVDVTAAFAVKPPLFLRAKRAPRAERALHRLLPAAGGNFFVGIRDPRAKYTSKMKQSTIQGGNRGSADVTKTEFDDLMMKCCSQKI